MKTLEQFPPNYLEIQEAFPMIDGEKHKPIFCYKDTIYNPFKINITPDLEHHESIHTKQQGDFPDIWWYNYIKDEQFRLRQELEAYGHQYKFVLDNIEDRKLREWGLNKMAEALSGEVYGNLLNFAQAKSKIRNYAKEI